MRSVKRSRDLLKVFDTHWLIVTAVIAALVLFNFAVQFLFQWYSRFLSFEIGLAFLTIIIPYVIKRIRHVSRYELVTPLSIFAGLSVEETESWLEGQMRPFFSGLGTLISAVMVLIAGVISTDIFGIPWYGYIRSTFYLWLCIFLLGYGIIAWLYIGLMVLVNRMRLLEVNASIFSWPKSEIHNIYSTYFQLLAIGAALYVVAVISVWVSPGGAWIAKNTEIGRLWVFPPGAMVIVFFLYFHYKVHLLLTQCRDKSDRQLSILLSQAFDEWISKQSEDKERSITNLLQWRKQIRSEKMWLLDIKSVIATVATLLLPTVKAVIDFLK